MTRQLSRSTEDPRPQKPLLTERHRAQKPHHRCAAEGMVLLMALPMARQTGPTHGMGITRTHIGGGLTQEARPEVLLVALPVALPAVIPTNQAPTAKEVLLDLLRSTTGWIGLRTSHSRWPKKRIQSRLIIC